MTSAESAEVPAVDAAPAVVFEFVYARYRRNIRLLMHSWVGNWDTADDLTAEMFTGLWYEMSRRGFVLTDPERAYQLLKLRSRWAFAKYCQANAARREVPFETDLVDDADKSRIEALATALTTDGPETTTVTRVDLARVIAILPNKQHQAILLRYLLDMAPNEVAQVTGWPPRTVSYHTVNALTALREVAGVSRGTKENTLRGAADRRAAMRQAYIESIQAGAPLTMPELARRFGRTANMAAKATADIPRPQRVIGKDQVRTGLRAALATGTIPAGTMMPTPAETAATYGGTPTVVGDVLRELAAEGLVVKLTGPGHGAHGRYHAAPAAPAAQLRETERAA